MEIIEGCHNAQSFPAHFFPNAAPGMKAYLWNCLTQPKATIHEAMLDYLEVYVHSPAERELADLIIESLVSNWHEYLAANHIFTHIQQNRA